MRASYLWALAILIAIAGWMASGDIIIGGQGDGGTPPPGAEDAARGVVDMRREAADDDQPFQVRVRTITAEERASELVVRGRTDAKQRVTLRAQTGGLVEELAADKGDLVLAGDLVCRIETGSRQANLLRAQAQLAQAEQEHTAAETLRERGHTAESQLRAARAARDAAKAAVADAELDLKRTRILAPFDGVVESRPAEPGALLNVGDICAEIATRDPMLVVAQVSERDIGRIETGMAGHAHLVTGEGAKGRISYISSSAETATRTFRVELEIPNSDGALRAGVTAQISIALEPVVAHRFSPAILSLADDGRIGVRTVDDDSRVRFLPVEVVADDRDAVWVTGLPESVTVITVGQDYVEEGERVDVTYETAEVRP
jgi:membrane fusion protein, multidrug efflux system